MGLSLVTSPAVEPVSLADVKRHLRLEHDDDDTILALYISAARQWIDGDGWLGRALITQTWELTLDEFPTSEIRLPLLPVQEITSVKYDDADGIEQTVDADDYYLDNTSQPSWLLPLSDVPWPSPMSGTNTVRVRFVAGYGDEPADVPAPIRAAILLMTGHLYANREAVMTGQRPEQLPLGVDALLAPYRVFI